MSENKVRKSQEEIYRTLFETHKDTPMAVSSESLAHKALRFNQICGILAEETAAVSVHDVGMGMADLYSYMKTHLPDRNILYSGSEILEEYVLVAKEKFPNIIFYHRDIAETVFDDQHDYLVMSGVFHQRQKSSIRDWENFCQQIIKNAFSMCNKGIAFNFISPFVDFYQTQVYYCNLPKLLNYINDTLSRFFKLSITMHYMSSRYMYTRKPI